MVVTVLDPLAVAKITNKTQLLLLIESLFM